jgi:SsrA-binding protein
VLIGPEVKSLRDGRANLKDSYARISKSGEVYLVGAHISPYGPATRDNLDPDRERKLLLQRGEIDRLTGKVRERGFTLVPTRMYFKNGRAKIEIGLARGKQAHDKRQDIRKAESRREIDRAMKSSRRSNSQ